MLRIVPLLNGGKEGIHIYMDNLPNYNRTVQGYHRFFLCYMEANIHRMRASVRGHVEAFRCTFATGFVAKILNHAGNSPTLRKIRITLEVLASCQPKIQLW